MISSTQVDYTTYRSAVDASNKSTYGRSKAYDATGGSEFSFKSLTEDALSIESISLSVADNSSFAVDKDGFFGVDFNKAAGIPDNIKIHKTMLLQAEAFAEVEGEKLDPVSVITRMWNLFKTITSDTLDPEGTGYMTQQETAAMPKSYISKGGIMDGIVSVQKDMDEYDAAVRLAGDVANVSDYSLDIGLRGFMAFDGVAPMDGNGETAFYGSRGVFNDYAGTAYEKNQTDDKLAVGELFGAFFFKRVDEETAEYVMEKKDSDPRLGRSAQATKAYYDYLSSGQDMKTYLTSTKGKDYMDEPTKRMTTLPDGTVDPELADMFFTELDKEQKALRTEYKANNYPELEPKKDSNADKQEIKTSSTNILLDAPTQTVVNSKTSAPTLGTVLQIATKQSTKISA